MNKTYLLMYISSERQRPIMRMRSLSKPARNNATAPASTSGADRHIGEGLRRIRMQVEDSMYAQGDVGRGNVPKRGCGGGADRVECRVGGDTLCRQSEDA